MDRRIRALLLLSLLGAASACEDLPPLSPAVAVRQPGAALEETIRTLAVGETVNVTLHSDGPGCVFDGDDLIAPCHRYAVQSSVAGTLVIRTSWDNPAHFLQIVLPWASFRDGINCCASPQIRRIPVAAQQPFEFQVWFIGATYGPGGHTPPAAEQPYELTTAFEPR